ncbi:MAG: glycoside hydrolase [Actinomycetota bacterium]|nr:glycoside hydrolase [Actinomycetota bacterium]
MRRGRLPVALLVVVAPVLAVVALRPRSPTVGANVFVNPAGLINAVSTPTLVQDPRRPTDLVAVYRQDRPRFSAALSWSTDGGVAWHTSPLPLPAGDSEAFFPDAAFAPDGTLYVTYTNLAGRGNVPATLFVARSNDGGRSLSAPVQVSGANAFQPRMVVGPHGAVHLTWLQVVAAPGAPLRTAPVMVVATGSTDGGRTFSPPAPVSPPGDNVTSPVPVVAGDGRLAVAYQVLGPIATGASGTDRSQLVVSHANPGGGFSAPAMVDDHVISHQISDPFDNLFPSVAGAPGSRLYLTWSTRRGGTEEVLVSHSFDGGAHWSTPVTVGSHLPATGSDSRYLPGVAVAPDGRVDVVFLTGHHDAFSDVDLASSSNGGRTFDERRLSSASFDAQFGPRFGPGLLPDVGSHLGLVSDQGGAVVA